MLWEKLAEQVLREISSGEDFMSPILASPLSRKALKSFMVTSAPCDYQQPS